MTISITKKLSGAHISATSSLTCVLRKFVKPLEPRLFKVFSVNPIFQENYHEKLDCEPTDLLCEIHHTYLGTNPDSPTPLFSDGYVGLSNSRYRITLSDFYELSLNDNQEENGSPELSENYSSPTAWKRELSQSLNGTFDIIKAYTTSTIIKITNSLPVPGNLPGYNPANFNLIEMGYLTYSYPYKLKNNFSLSCSVVDPDIPQPTVTLNFETLEIPWEPNTTYTIEVGNNFVNHAYGEKYGNPSFVETFTTNPPAQVIDFDHTNKKLTIEYIRNIKKVTGTYSLYKYDGTLVENYDHVSSTINGKFIEFDTYRDLKPLTTYYLLSSTGPCLDKDNISAEQITDINLVRYITGPAPMVNKLFPGNFVENMPLGNIEETTHSETYPAGVVKSKITKFILNWDRPIDRFFGVGGTTSIFLYGKPTGSIESPSIIEEWDFHWYEAPEQHLYSYDFNTTQIVLDMVPGLLREDYDYSFLIIPEIARDDDYFYNFELSGGVLDFTTDSYYFPGLKSNLDSTLTLDILPQWNRNVEINSLLSTTMLINANEVPEEGIIFAPVISSMTTTAIRNIGPNYPHLVSNSSMIIETRMKHIGSAELRSSVQIIARPSLIYKYALTSPISGSSVYGWSTDTNSSGYIVVGDYGKNYVHLYNYYTGAKIYSILAPTLSSLTYFGYSVAINDTHFASLAVQPGDPTLAACYIYRISDGQLERTVTASDLGRPSTGYPLGLQIDMNSTHLFIGSTGTNPAKKIEISTGTISDTKYYAAHSNKQVNDTYTIDSSIDSSVKVYNISNNQLIRTFNNPNEYGDNSDNFGWNVSMHSDRILIGASGADSQSTTDSGAAYLYSISTGQLLYKFEATEVVTGGFRFGWETSITQDFIFIGAGNESVNVDGTLYAMAGKIYVYDASTFQLKYVIDDPNINGTPYDDNFGLVISSSGEYCTITARNEKSPGTNNKGVVYVYHLTP